MQIKAVYKSRIVLLIMMLLAVLYSYTVASKIADMEDFKQSMYNQSFPRDFANALILFIPGVEILTLALLSFNKTRLAGLCLSAFVLSLFTGYIALVLLGFYENHACSCGGVLKSLGWKEHLYFNLFFLSINIVAIQLHLKSRKEVSSSL